MAIKNASDLNEAMQEVLAVAHESTHTISELVLAGEPEDPNEAARVVDIIARHGVRLAKCFALLEMGALADHMMAAQGGLASEDLVGAIGGGLGGLGGKGNGGLSN